MYNRYISQPDGSFEKKPVAEMKDTVPQQIPPPKTEEKKAENPKQTMPFEMDTGDMLVFVMLLLINGGGNGNEYNALLTLVFYLFL